MGDRGLQENKEKQIYRITVITFTHTTLPFGHCFQFSSTEDFKVSPASEVFNLILFRCNVKWKNVNENRRRGRIIRIKIFVMESPLETSFKLIYAEFIFYFRIAIKDFMFPWGSIVYWPRRLQKLNGITSSFRM